MADASLGERRSEAASSSLPWLAILPPLALALLQRRGPPLLPAPLHAPSPLRPSGAALTARVQGSPWVHPPWVVGTIPGPLTFPLSPAW